MLNWTEELKTQFTECQKAVIQCRKLYYEEEGAPIRVYTDASEYGIGAYLCQVQEDGVEIPIEFISKTLTKAERKWSTYEKEAFAIFYALRKWEYYLRDIKFTIFTDHKNLTFLAADPNAKVMRWRMAVQDYDFDIAYIPGEDNIVADAFSRLCAKHTPEEDAEVEIFNSIASLKVNIDKFDVWDPIRQNSDERHHDQYYVIQGQIDRFKELHCSVSYNYAIQTQLQVKKTVFKHIPQDKYNIIKLCHNYEIGHWGENRTIELVQSLLDKDPKYAELEWKGMRKDVQAFIRKCDCCNKMNETHMKSHIKKYTTSEYGVMKCIAIDAIHMPKTKSGFQYILTVIDCFTRYTALYAIKDLTAQTAAKTMINHMYVYGVPDKIISDNSTEYEAEFKEMLSILQIENYRIHAYSHQENGIVERANKEVVRHMRNIAYELR
jgi:cleavage and polyadenylation specificity factor subunit 1